MTSRAARIFALTLLALLFITALPAFADPGSATAFTKNYQGCLGTIGQTTANGIASPINGIVAATSGWLTVSTQIANRIFYVLFGVEMLWFIISLGRRMYGSQMSMEGLFDNLFFKILNGGFFLALISWIGTNGNIMGLMTGFVNYANQIVSANGAVSSSVFAGGSGISQLTLGPGTLTAQGICLGANIVAAPFLNLPSFNLFTDAGALLGAAVALGLALICGLLAMIAFLILAGQLFITIIEATLISSAGVLILGFTGSRWTLPFAQSYFQYLYSTAIKLFTTYIIAGFSVSLASVVINSFTAYISSLPTNPGGAVAAGALQLAQYFALSAALSIILMLAVRVPSLASSFVTGAPAMSVGSLLETAAAVGATAAAVALGAASAGVGAAAALQGGQAAAAGAMSRGTAGTAGSMARSAVAASGSGGGPSGGGGAPTPMPRGGPDGGGGGGDAPSAGGGAGSGSGESGAPSSSESPSPTSSSEGGSGDAGAGGGGAAAGIARSTIDGGGGSSGADSGGGTGGGDDAPSSPGSSKPTLGDRIGGAIEANKRRSKVHELSHQHQSTAAGPTIRMTHHE